MIKIRGLSKALMDVHVERNDGENSICAITLHTGRFHQIRALMGHIKHPLFGDVKYGYHGKKRPIKLMAYRLEFHDVDLPLQQTVFGTSKSIVGGMNMQEYRYLLDIALIY